MIQLLRLLRDSAGSDRDLLDRFARDRDEGAFEALVRRYGTGVWAACVRLAGRDAEDAFQAVLLTLSRKAGTVTGSLPAWLHAVTRRVAANLRWNARRTTEVEAAAARPPEALTDDVSLREGLALLDEELSRLSEPHRAVLIVCCLEGCSRNEAAAQLGWSEGQVKGRLERARELLRSRLARRGVELGGVFLAAAITGPFPVRADPPSAAAVALTNRVIRDMAIQKLKLVAAALAAVVAVGALLARGSDEPHQPAKAADPKVEVAATPVRAAPTVQDLSAALGVTWWEFDLPKGVRAVELGILENGKFAQMELCDLRPGVDVPGRLRVAYQDDGSPEFRVTVITGGGTLRTRAGRPSDVVRTHATAVRSGKYLELASFKGPKDNGWSSALVLKVVKE